MLRFRLHGRCGRNSHHPHWVNTHVVDKFHLLHNICTYTLLTIHIRMIHSIGIILRFTNDSNYRMIVTSHGRASTNNIGRDLRFTLLLPPLLLARRTKRPHVNSSGQKKRHTSQKKIPFNS